MTILSFQKAILEAGKEVPDACILPDGFGTRVDTNSTDTSVKESSSLQ